MGWGTPVGRPVDVPQCLPDNYKRETCAVPRFFFSPTPLPPSILILPRLNFFFLFYVAPKAAAATHLWPPPLPPGRPRLVLRKFFGKHEGVSTVQRLEGKPHRWARQIRSPAPKGI